MSDATVGPIRTRKVRRFSWEAVHPTVSRAILRQIYMDSEREDDARRVRTLSERALHTSLSEGIGEPPALAAFSPAVVRVLRDTWLPRASNSDLHHLTESLRVGRAGAAIDTKSERLEFLVQRRLTTSYQALLRKAFVAAHRVQSDTPALPRGDARVVGIIELDGAGESTPRPWYPHQVQAHQRLDELATHGPIRGRIVLPTGAGKTDTMAWWLLQQMEQRPEVRVLWLVHQQELVDQAMLRFRSLA